MSKLLSLLNATTEPIAMSFIEEYFKTNFLKINLSFEGAIKVKDLSSLLLTKTCFIEGNSWAEIPTSTFRSFPRMITIAFSMKEEMSFFVKGELAGELSISSIEGSFVKTEFKDLDVNQDDVYVELKIIDTNRLNDKIAAWKKDEDFRKQLMTLCVTSMRNNWVKKGLALVKNNSIVDNRFAQFGLIPDPLREFPYSSDSFLFINENVTKNFSLLGGETFEETFFLYDSIWTTEDDQLWKKNAKDNSKLFYEEILSSIKNLESKREIVIKI